MGTHHQLQRKFLLEKLGDLVFLIALILIMVWCDSVKILPTVGTIEFGNDGSLLVSSGEGSHWDRPDWGQDTTK